MKNIKIFDLNIGKTVVRFYLMMAVVIIFGFLGQFTLAAILGYILGISFILGVRVGAKDEKATAKRIHKLDFEKREKAIRKVA
ncbi:MAG: hypothetical protein R2788_19525 [Saprospiraceae bacterium]